MAARTLILFITLFFALTARRAQAVTKTWIGSDGGSFSTPGNWDPGGTPGTADALVFANGAVGSTYDINFDVDATVTQLTVATNPLAFAGAHALAHQHVADKSRSRHRPHRLGHRQRVAEHVARAAQYDLRRCSGSTAAPAVRSM